MEKLIFTILILKSFLFTLHCQHTSGIITFEKEYTHKIYNSMEEYGMIAIDTTTLSLYGKTSIQVIIHDTTKEVLFRVDSLRYYFNKYNSYLISIQEYNNQMDTSVFCDNYIDSSYSYIKVKNGIMNLKHKSNLYIPNNKDVSINKDLYYLDDKKLFNQFVGFKIDGAYSYKVWSFDIIGYVTNEIRLPHNYFLDDKYPIPYTPLELIKESKYEKWIYTMKNFKPLQLLDPLEALKKDYNLK